MTQSQSTQNPLDLYAKPPFPKQQQEPTGSEARMQPKPDYGEESYKGSGKLTGKAAIITGADSGIGRAVALAYAREGADALFTYLEADQDAEETIRVVEASGRKAIAMKGDIGDESFCQQVVRRAVQEFGHLDILVNNAGYQQTHENITEIPSDEIERVFRTNILAMFWLCKAAAKELRPGGTVINTASIEAYQPASVLLDYAATKGAIVTFTKGLAKQFIENGVRVNAVAPGPVWTPLIPMSMPTDWAMG